MPSPAAFVHLVRQHPDDWPRLADLVLSMRHATRQRRLPVDRSSLFQAKNPDYWTRELNELDVRYNAWRQLFMTQDIDALRAEQENAKKALRDLATGGMNMGRAYRRIAAIRRIALLEEFIRLKAVAADWPSAGELVSEDDSDFPD